MKLTLKLIAIVLILATAFLLTDPFTSDAEAGWGCWGLIAGAIATCATASPLYVLPRGRLSVLPVVANNPWIPQDPADFSKSGVLADPLSSEG